MPLMPPGQAPISPLAKMFQMAHGYLPKPAQIPGQMMGMPTARPPEGGQGGMGLPGLSPDMIGGLSPNLPIAPGAGSLPQMGGIDPAMVAVMKGLW